jgi:hypothetical protein
MVKQRHAYNERGDLPKIKPMATAIIGADGQGGQAPVIGCRLDLRDGIPAADRLAAFDDGKTAGASVRHGGGRVLAFGFLPMLAYSPFKPGQTTLDETWPAAPRGLVGQALDAAKVVPVARADVPVVETSLLTGPAGSALVLVNYTYKPIARLRVELHVAHPVAKAISTEGVAIAVRKTGDAVVVELPLDWTDIVLLPRE